MGSSKVGDSRTSVSMPLAPTLPRTRVLTRRGLLALFGASCDPATVHHTASFATFDSTFILPAARVFVCTKPRLSLRLLLAIVAIGKKPAVRKE